MPKQNNCKACVVLCPVSCVLCPVSCVLCPVSCVLCPVSEPEPPCPFAVADPSCPATVLSVDVCHTRTRRRRRLSNDYEVWNTFDLGFDYTKMKGSFLLSGQCGNAGNGVLFLLCVYSSLQ